MFTQRVLLLAALCLLIHAAKGASKPSQVTRFRPITQSEYDAILKLTDGKPVVSEGRLITSGLAALAGLTTGWVTSLRLADFLSFLGISQKSAEDSYPLCVIKTDGMENSGNHHQEHSSTHHYHDQNSDEHYDSAEQYYDQYYHQNDDSHEYDDHYDGHEHNHEHDHGDLHDHNHEHDHGDSHDHYHEHDHHHDDKPSGSTATTGHKNRLAPVVNCIVVLKKDEHADDHDHYHAASERRKRPHRRRRPYPPPPTDYDYGYSAVHTLPLVPLQSAQALPPAPPTPPSSPPSSAAPSSASSSPAPGSYNNPWYWQSPYYNPYYSYPPTYPFAYSNIYGSANPGAYPINYPGFFPLPFTSATASNSIDVDNNTSASANFATASNFGSINTHYTQSSSSASNYPGLVSATNMRPPTQVTTETEEAEESQQTSSPPFNYPGYITEEAEDDFRTKNYNNPQLSKNSHSLKTTSKLQKIKSKHSRKSHAQRQASKISSRNIHRKAKRDESGVLSKSYAKIATYSESGYQPALYPQHSYTSIYPKISYTQALPYSAPIYVRGDIQ